MGERLSDADRQHWRVLVAEARDRCALPAEVWGPMLGQALDELDRLHAAVKQHYDQKADDRCWQDDTELYAAFGLPPADIRVGDQEAMLKNCERFLAWRTAAGGWPSYAELEAEIKRLKARPAEDWPNLTHQMRDKLFALCQAAGAETADRWLSEAACDAIERLQALLKLAAGRIAVQSDLLQQAVERSTPENGP
jgi:hypothetical protein